MSRTSRVRKMEVDEVNDICYFELCPKEIYENIFKHLQPKDLMSCMLVNKTWRAIADYCGNYYNIWQTLVKDNMPSNGAKFLQKTSLTYRNIYLNYCMWHSVHTAQVKVKHVYDLKDVRNVSVYMGNLIAVCINSVKFIDIENCTIVKEIPGKYLDYQETEYLVAKVTLKNDKKHISLYSKRHDTTHKTTGITVYRVHQNKCYLCNYKNIAVLYECLPGKFDMFLLSRFYSDPTLLFNIIVYEANMYLYVGRGDVYWHKYGALGLRKVCTLNVPNPPARFDTNPTEKFMTMFYTSCVVYGVQSKEKEGITKYFDIHGEEQLVLLYHDLTCATEHGDILLLGFKDGKVGIVLVPKLRATNDMAPVYRFYVKHTDSEGNVEPIRMLEAYEGEGCHHVLVFTTTSLYQVVVYHADYNKVMP